ncbi:MAG: type II methionyl aminopeptidase [Thermoprotei archaeon]|nr:MAG: type II methionyl aminopeptidase [Thermoprotei archaeon]RLF03585.1 MAG: type II methionyl aminopeptidase [Thermoprotei archaeon]
MVLDCYRRAGKVVYKALKLALNLVEEDKPVLEICEKLEGFIINSGARPAFPVNISINQVAAHYTADIEDELTVPRKGIVKVDIGVHVDGFIADAALSIPLGVDYLELVDAAYNALVAAIRAMKPFKPLQEIGVVIEREITKMGFNPIRNLSGHLIDRYNLHAGKSVPNTGIGYPNVVSRTGEVYAIEPFATNGVGEVVEGNVVTIFRLSSLKRVKRDKKANEIIKKVWSSFRSLPFAKRWLARLIGRSQVDEVIAKLANYKAITGYPVLVERSAGMVSQMEDTIILASRRETINLTRAIEIYRELRYR